MSNEGSRMMLTIGAVVIVGIFLVALHSGVLDNFRVWLYTLISSSRLPL